MKEKIEVLNIERVKQPKHLEIYEMEYLQDNRLYKKEVQRSLDIVKILIYHKEKDAFILTKQFRPLLYINHPNFSFRVELCGGRVDKDLPLEEIAKEEVLEETGYRVNNLQKITTLYTNSQMNLYYCEVDESMRENSGGGLDYESIEVITLPKQEAKELMFDESISKRPGLMFCLCWFFHMR